MALFIRPVNTKLIDSLSKAGVLFVDNIPWWYPHTLVCVYE